MVFGESSINRLVILIAFKTLIHVAGLANNSGSPDGTFVLARFGGPNGIAIDSSGNLFVAEDSNSIIRKITF